MGLNYLPDLNYMIMLLKGRTFFEKRWLIKKNVINYVYTTETRGQI